MPLINLLFSFVVGIIFFFITKALGLPLQEATIAGCTIALLIVIVGNGVISTKRW